MAALDVYTCISNRALAVPEQLRGLTDCLDAAVTTAAIEGPYFAGCALEYRWVQGLVLTVAFADVHGPISGFAGRC